MLVQSSPQEELPPMPQPALVPKPRPQPPRAIPPPVQPAQPVVQPAVQPVPKPAPQPVPKPVAQPVQSVQPAAKPAPQPTQLAAPIPQTVSKPAQPTQPVPKPAPQPTQPAPQPVPRPVAPPVPRPMPQPLPQPLHAPQPRPVPQPLSQPMPQPMPHPMPRSTPQPMPHPMPRSTPQPMPQSLPRSTPQPMPRSTPQPLSQPLHTPPVSHARPSPQPLDPFPREGPPMRIVPVMPSITATPAFTNPGTEIDVSIVISEKDCVSDDWLGLFKSYQHQALKAITQRQIAKLHYTRIMSNGERFKKYSCRFYAPKHAGRYCFRYFHFNDYYSILDSNEIMIRGCDLDEAVDFVQQKINEPSMVSFNINSLHSTFQYVVDWNGWKHPDVLWRILFKLTDPLYETPVPDTYTTQVNSNLKYLLDLLMQQPYLRQQMSDAIFARLSSLVEHYCHICNVFIVDDAEMTAHMRDRHSLPPTCRLVPFSQPFINLLTKQCVLEFKSLCPQPSFYQTRENLINRLMAGFNSHKRFERSVINIYGSSNNGFGTDGSDIDLCLIDPSIDREKIMEIADEVAAILEEMHMEEIDKSRLHARIPVIRFEDPVTHIQSDLCFNNILPIRNTLLLKTYSFIDPRVRILGIIIKKWAKVNRLNNPILKTLSSYGFMLMLIHFLQSAVSPPDLPPNWNGLAPVAGASLPQMVVTSYEGVTYNTYFYQPRDLHLLNRFAQQNTMTVGELLIEFFYYYGYQFDYIHSVVTIRKQGVLDREEKCCDSIWKMMMQLCIEDPFEIDYDVAHVITPTSSSMIQEYFAKSYVMLMNMDAKLKDLNEPNILEELFNISMFKL
ncbi:hypothetical protein BLSTO_04942 [Blastocystis sp. subtype 1]